MRQRKQNLPPLNYLQAFEAAARDQSFVSASKALGISESAVSRKVRLLEEFYETPLFKRGHKSIALTKQGTSLFKGIEPAMETLRAASGKLASHNAQSEVILAATNSVASLWLMPRLRKFNQANKQLNIMLVASDDDDECLAETVDLSILRGDGNWPDFTAQKLFGEIVFPVCSPGFLRRNPSLDGPTSLLHMPLIEVSSSHPEWMNWNTWLQDHMPVVPELSKPSVFNAYPHAIQAAVDGLGVALGWGHLVDHLLKSGALVRPLNELHTRTPFGYYLLERDKKITSNPRRDIVRDWLMSESAARTPYAS